MPLRPRKAREDEVCKCWWSLSPEQRCSKMTFEDPRLVERIEAAVQAMFVSHMMIAGDKDALAAATFFTSAFEFGWDDVRSQPVLTMKKSFASNLEIFKLVRAVLPDLFCSSRPALHRVRWKDLWATRPTSVQALEQAIAKLMEQAFWAAVADPHCAVICADPLPGILSEGCDSDSDTHSARIQKKTTSAKKAKASKKPAHSQQRGAKHKTSHHPGGRQKVQGDDEDQLQHSEIVASALKTSILSCMLQDTIAQFDIDDDCSTCSGASSFQVPSLEASPKSLCSELTAKSSQSSFITTQEPDKKTCYVWGEAGQWQILTANQTGYRLRAVVKNTFLDLDESAASSGRRRSSSWSQCSKTKGCYD